MARQRFRRKDLKRPDPFMSQGQQLLEWGATHQSRLLGASAAVLAVLLAAAGYVALGNSRAAQASAEMARAVKDLDSDHYAEAEKQFSAIAEHWSSTAPGRLAPLYAAKAAIKANNSAAALTSLQHLQSSKLPAYLEQQVPLLTGFAEESAGNVEEAAKSFERAAALNGPYTGAAILQEARARERLGQKEQARKLYERFLQEFPQAAEVDVVKDRLAAL
jgi:outer membrane protein assembly factor BamD (BamD/ComL family)